MQQQAGAADEFADGGLHPGYAFPLWHAFLALVGKLAGEDLAAGAPCYIKGSDGLVFVASGISRTLAFVEETKEFVCNLATFELRTAVVATADFFTPVVDSAYDWGRIAALYALDVDVSLAWEGAADQPRPQPQQQHADDEDARVPPQGVKAAVRQGLGVASRGARRHRGGAQGSQGSR